VLVTTHDGRDLAGYQKGRIHFKCIPLLLMIDDGPKKEAGSGFGRLTLHTPPMAVAVHTSFGRIYTWNTTAYSRTQTGVNTEDAHI